MICKRSKAWTSRRKKDPIKIREPKLAIGWKKKASKIICAFIFQLAFRQSKKMRSIYLLVSFCFLLISQLLLISYADEFHDANAEFHDAVGPIKDNDANGQKFANTPSIRYSKIRAHFEYKSTVQLFGVNYYFNMDVNGVINGRMTLKISKESEKDDKREQIIKDFGGEMEDFEGFEGTEVRTREEANYVLELNDFLENQVHKTVMELTQKAMQNKRANEKPELGEEFTKELANKMIEDLGNHKQYGDIFKGLNPKHKAANKPPNFIQGIQGALAHLKNRLTPIQFGPGKIRLSVFQQVAIDNTMTNFNVLFNMDLLPTGPKGCFEIFTQTKEKGNGGKGVDMHFVVGEDGQPQICLFQKNTKSGDVEKMNPLQLAALATHHFRGHLIKGAQVAVMTMAKHVGTIMIAGNLLGMLLG